MKRQLKRLAKNFLVTAFAPLIASAAFMPVAQANPIEDIYTGQTLTILLSHPPGGSYDLYGQLAAEFIGSHIPGHPTVIVQHMPGGGGRKATAFFVNNVEPDGLTVAIVPDNMGHVQLLTPKRAKWDANKFRYIGRFAPANSAYAIRRDAPAQTLEEMRKTRMVAGCTGVSARGAQQLAALKNAGHLNLQLICGYAGSQAAKLATLRGEVDLFSVNWASLASDPTDLDSGDLRIVLQAGLERDKDLPDVPLLMELGETDDEKAVLRFVSTGAPIGRSMMAHPDSDEAIISALRTAFQEMITSAEFLAEAERRKAIINPASGEELEAIVSELMSASPELITLAKEAMDTSDAGAVAK